MKLFLSGDRQVGKSTIIGTVLESVDMSYGGFMSWATPFSDEGYSQVYLQKVDYDVSHRSTEAMVGRRVKGSGFCSFPEVFDQAGVAFLADAMIKDLLIFDELGNMEAQAMLFQAQIMALMDSSIPVLGVIKPLDQRNCDFLLKIRQHSAFQELVVTKDNREEMVDTVLRLICQNN